MAWPKAKPGTEVKRRLKTGTVLVREYQGERHTVTVAPDGFVWQAATYGSLSTIARAITGTAWGGPRFFGLRSANSKQEDQEPDEPTAKPKQAGRVGTSRGRRRDRISEVQA